ncbi:hypothetical protein ACVWW2_002141 [Bradyrhizobium sp. LM4.3]
MATPKARAFRLSSSASCAIARPSSLTSDGFKDEYLSWCYVKGRAGDATNVVLSAVGATSAAGLVQRILAPVALSRPGGRLTV